MENEKRLIDANAVLDLFTVQAPSMTYSKMFMTVANAPTVDAMEVVHGRWVGEANMKLNLPQLSAYDDWHCSECDWVYPERHIRRLSNYCPNCGAKMDGDGNGM